MKERSSKKPRTVMRLAAMALIGALLPVFAWGAGNPLPLSQIPVPEPPNLAEFVKDKAAAIKLGKALFWDQQVGSDGITACASCHYRAGADPIDQRAKNQLNPGPDGAFSVLAGPNLTLDPAATYFPFTQVTDPLTAELKKGLALTNNFNDVGGSQGVTLKKFSSIVIGQAVDSGSDLTSPLFGTFRQVTGRNTPPAVNAIFNYANFWDGRANNIFNGNNPIGPLDVNAGVWVNGGGPSEPVLVKAPIVIPNASLASQATGPPLSSVEMSWDGRTWPMLGRKMLNLPPLALQHVSASDSVLGPFAGAPGTGLKPTETYDKMIKDAFQPKYWSMGLTTPDGFTQMEANFSLFWGLAIQLYEATLVSDLTPYDCFLGDTNPKCTDGTVTPMGADAVAGFGVFQSKCAMCHSGSEFTDASVSNALANGLIEKGQTNAGGAISDVGFHNLGARPTAEDIGRGGVINFDLSFSRQALDAAQTPPTIPFAPPQPLPAGITAATPAAVNGTFKTPGLRNIALTAPYMHDGSMATLAEVVDFYSRGGNFANAEQSKDMNAPVGLNATKRAQLVAFLNALTDPRVAAESAPFDHPDLPLPNGIDRAVTGNTIDFNAILNKPAETTTLADLPVAVADALPTGTTKETSATITVKVQNGDTCKYTIDATSSVAPVDPATNTVTISLNGLADGPHTLTITGMNSQTGRLQLTASRTTANWTVKTTPPNVTVNQPETMTKKSTQTISGTVDAGGKVTVSVDTGATVGPVAVSGTTWTCQVSGLSKGSNNITVTATDALGNSSSKATNVKILIADGCFRGTGSPDISDALKALRMSVGIIATTSDDLLHGDITADGKIDTGDALLILRKVAGLSSF